MPDISNDNSDKNTSHSYQQALQVASVDDLCHLLTGGKRSQAPLLFNAVILTFLSLATILGAAELPALPQELRAKLLLLGAPLGMRQAWRVFAPELRTVNWHTLCIIEMADGTLKGREFPRLEKLSASERFIHEKERNCLGERLPSNFYKRFRPAVARFYARANADKSNPPVFVTFIFASAPDLTLTGANFYYRDQLPEHIFKQVYFDYKVNPEDLIN